MSQITLLGGEIGRLASKALRIFQANRLILLASKRNSATSGVGRVKSLLFPSRGLQH